MDSGWFTRSNLEKAVYWCNIVISLLLIAAGIISIITFFIQIAALLNNPLGFTIFVYCMYVESCGALSPSSDGRKR